MKKFQSIRGFKLMLVSAFLILLGCETTNKKNALGFSQEYTQLDQNNPKDKEFYKTLEKSLKNQGSLISVCADTQELNLYRNGKRPYPTNYRYTLKANQKISLEEIKQANLSLQK
jgi:hypothetical protein